jgi:hypothetical protein
MVQCSGFFGRWLRLTKYDACLQNPRKLDQQLAGPTQQMWLRSRAFRSPTRQLRHICLAGRECSPADPKCLLLFSMPSMLLEYAGANCSCSFLMLIRFLHQITGSAQPMARKPALGSTLFVTPPSRSFRSHDSLPKEK